MCSSWLSLSQIVSFKTPLQTTRDRKNPEVGLLLLAGLDILCMPEPILTQRLQHFSTSVRRKTWISCIMTFEDINMSNMTFHILTQQDFKIQNQQGQVTRFDRAQALSALLHLQLVVYIAWPLGSWGPFWKISLWVPSVPSVVWALWAVFALWALFWSREPPPCVTPVMGKPQAARGAFQPWLITLIRCDKIEMMTWGFHRQGLLKFFENATHIIFSSFVVPSYFISSLILTFFIASARLFEAQSKVRCHAQKCVYALVWSLPIKMPPRSVRPWNDICHLSLTVSCSFGAKTIQNNHKPCLR